MVNKAKREEILQLLQDGKITLEEATQLLDTLEEYGEEQAPDQKPRRLHVRVTDNLTQETRVSFSLPISLVRMGLKLGVRFIPQLQGMDAAALEAALLHGEEGLIVDAVDEELDEHLEIYLD